MMPPLMLLLLYLGVLFGAASCASAGAILAEQYQYDEDARQQPIFARPLAAGAASAPFYYVSYDLYQNTCANERCDDVADLFLRSVKKSMFPCDDFYAYSCGRKQNKMLSLTKEIQEILEEPTRPDDGSTKSLTIERTFYRSCMQQRETDYRTRREFRRLLEISGGLDLMRGTPKSRDAWPLIDGFYASLGYEHAFFNAHVTRDPQRDDVNLIALMPPSPLYFYSIHGLLRNKNFTSILANLFEGHDSDYTVSYEDVIEFNNALHEILPPLGMFEENITTLVKNKMTINEWQSLYDSVTDDFVEERQEKNHVNWLKVLNAHFKMANIQIHGSESIVLKNIDYFKKLAGLLARTSPSTVEKYIHIKFLTQISKYLSPSLAKFFENVPDRSTFCIKQSDNRLIGATYEYIKRHVPHEHKLYAEQLAENIRNALAKLLSSAQWMDKETKVFAISKLRNLNMIVGYPDWQRNRTFVNAYYGNLNLHMNFFENVIKYKRMTLLHELRGLRHSHTYDPSTMSKKLVPLIYHFEVNGHMNRILFPTEYLNEKKYKLFSKSLPSAINYGSFGSMLGSILYDYVSLTDNLRYNEFYTRTIEGLSKDTIDAYKVKEKCLSNQLINYKKRVSKFDQPLASLIDRDTIQVDKIYEKMSGLRAAFEAYRLVESENEELLPGFEDMNNHQLFFLSYAERICEIGDIYDRYDAYETALKVNGVVSNLESFSRVFRCPADSAMDRKVKCELF